MMKAGLEESHVEWKQFFFNALLRCALFDIDPILMRQKIKGLEKVELSSTLHFIHFAV